MKKICYAVALMVLPLHVILYHYHVLASDEVFQWRLNDIGVAIMWVGYIGTIALLVRQLTSISLWRKRVLILIFDAGFGLSIGNLADEVISKNIIFDNIWEYVALVVVIFEIIRKLVIWKKKSKK